MRRARRVMIIGLALAVTVIFTASALAYSGDWYVNFARNKVFKCIHPKSKIVKVELVKPPKVNKDVETATVKIYYKGWIKKHRMEMEIMTTQIQGKLNAKVRVLMDTSSIRDIRCKLVKGWQMVQ